MNPRPTRRMLRLALAGAAAVAVAAPASAGAATITPCDPDATTARTFAPWLDPLYYKLAPGGDFEPGSPEWRLGGGAEIVDGNAPQRVGGASDAHALSLPRGASATSPATCVGPAEPLLRMFSTGPRMGAVLVQAVYDRVTLPAGVATGGRWSPTLPMFTGAGIGGSSFSIRLTNVGLGTMQVDDVYVDPYRRG